MNRPTRDSAAGRAYLDLPNRARREKRGTQELLTMYVVERWLARLSHSPYVDDFVLKGGMLLASFGTRRPTVDADTLARNMASDEATVARRIAEIASLKDPDDGVEFLPRTVTTAVIRDDSLYSGVRVTMGARLATAQVKLRLDIDLGPSERGPGSVMDLSSRTATVAGLDMMGWFLLLALLRWRTCSEAMTSTHADTQGCDARSGQQLPAPGRLVLARWPVQVR